MAQQSSIIFNSFLDGFTGAGLFGRLRRPGAPTEYVDSRSVEEFMGSGEYAATVARFHAAVAEEERGYAHPVTIASGGVGGVARHESSQHLAKYMSGHR